MPNRRFIVHQDKIRYRDWILSISAPATSRSFNQSKSKFQSKMEKICTWINRNKLQFKLINHAMRTTLHATAKGRTRFLPARTWSFFTGRCIIRIKIGMASCISCHYWSGDVQSLLLLQRKFCFKFVCCSHSLFQAVRSTDTRCSFGVADFHICLDSSTSWQMMQGKYSVSRLFLIFSFILNIQWQGKKYRIGG